jgi:hypothetical protein
MPNDDNDNDNDKVREVTFLNRSGRKSEPPNCSVNTSADFGERKPYPEQPGTSPLKRLVPINKKRF